MSLKPEPPPEGAVDEARKMLVKTVAAYLPSRGESVLTAQDILDEYEQFVQDYVKIVGLVFSGSKAEGIRLAFVRGLLSEILESLVKLSGGDLEELRPFILAGRITGSISPERAKELVQSRGYGYGDLPEVIN